MEEFQTSLKSDERKSTMGIQIRCWLIAMRIFGLSLRIRRNRAAMAHMVKQGGPYTSPRLMNLNEDTVQLCYRTHKLLQKWENAQPRAHIHQFPAKQDIREEQSA